MVCQGGFEGHEGPTGNATLNHAQAVASDAEGNLYIADTINHRIRRIDGSTGLISTIAGTGIKGFRGDGGTALAAEISFPAGIAVDASGKVYFAGEGNDRIRVLTSVARRTDPVRHGLRPLEFATAQAPWIRGSPSESLIY